MPESKVNFKNDRKIFGTGDVPIGGGVKLRERAPYSEQGVVSPLVRKLSL